MRTSYDTLDLFQGALGTYYYFCVSNSKSAFVAEFKLQ